MTDHTIATHQQWLAARLELLADAQVFGCHHPMIAATKHKTEMPVCMLTSIQYRTGAVSL
jgi:hypothetical protein